MSGNEKTINGSYRLKVLVPRKRKVKNSQPNSRGLEMFVPRDFHVGCCECLGREIVERGFFYQCTDENELSSLLNKTLPPEDFKFPAIKLNKVVFPEPFGPIMPVIDPLLIFNEQLDTAAKPPKYFDRLFI